MSDKCIPNSKCGNNQWYWWLACIASVAYALWYTFKDDTVSLLYYCLNLKQKTTCTKKKQNDALPGNEITEEENVHPMQIKIAKAKNISIKQDIKDKPKISGDSTLAKEKNKGMYVDKGYFGICNILHSDGSCDESKN